MKEGLGIFVYGTLRVGQGNWEYYALPAMADEADINVQARGKIWYAFPNGYPVAKFGAKYDDGIVKGDIIWCDPTHPRTRQMIEMELHAGYEQRVIDVQLQDKTPLRVMAFSFLRSCDDLIEIESGDWVLDAYGMETPDDFDPHNEMRLVSEPIIKEGRS